MLDPAKCAYSLNGAPSGTTVSASGLISAGATAGDCDMTVTFVYEGTTFTDQCAVSVKEA